MGTKKLDTATRQRQIVEEALRIVAQHGLESLSLGELAHRSGLVPSGIYRHFHGKDEIILAVLDFVRDNLFQFLEAAQQETSDPVDCLQRLFGRHLKLLKDNPGIPRVVFSGAVFSEDAPKRDKAREIIEGYLTRVAHMIRVGQEGGRIRSDRDPRTMSVMFLGLILPMIILSRVGEDEDEWDSHAEKAWNIFSGAIEQPIDSRYRLTETQDSGIPVRKEKPV